MNKFTWIVLAVALFLSIGNSEDETISQTPPPEGWGVQGNARWTRAAENTELEKAANLARQKKAVMESMAGASIQPPTITTAEQYLQVHRPPSAPSGERPIPAVRRDAYVPEFEPVRSKTGRGDTPAVENVSPTPNPSPTKPKSSFSLLGKKRSTAEDATNQAVNQPEKKTSFWRKFLGGERATEPSFSPEASPPYTSASPIIATPTETPSPNAPSIPINEPQTPPSSGAAQ